MIVELRGAAKTADNDTGGTGCRRPVASTRGAVGNSAQIKIDSPPRNGNGRALSTRSTYETS